MLQLNTGLQLCLSLILVHIKNNKMISKHISNKEGVYSATALRRGLDNTPHEEQLSNMKLIAEKIFEPLREYVGGPIKINSFFRSSKLSCL